MQYKNPKANILPERITKGAMDDAIKSSGYPLQQIVARQLHEHGFGTKNEWGFKDYNSGKNRSADLMATMQLYELRQISNLRVRPQLDLIIECKKSTDPYVFFLGKENVFNTQFPLVAGLRTNDISIHTDDNPSSYIVSPTDITGLRNHPFLQSEPAISINFTKVGFNGGNRLTLSGDEPFNALLMPLLSAMRACAKIENPIRTAMYFDAHIILGLAVLDAPMYGVRVTNKGHTSKSIPWVRVYRHEPVDGATSIEHDGLVYAIDVIHKDFLDEYISKHLIGFATEWGKRVQDKQHVLLSGNGFMRNLGKTWPTDFSSVEPYKIPAKAKRITSIRKILNRG